MNPDGDLADLKPLLSGFCIVQAVSYLFLILRKIRFIKDLQGVVIKCGHIAHLETFSLFP